MYIIAGLGNPEPKYKGTRHNVGFEVINKTCFDCGIELASNRRLYSHAGQGVFCGTNVVLIKPKTYMNLSGKAVAATLRHFDLGLDRLVVVYDDVALPLGEIRVRATGSAGGQKGMIDIIHRIGADFARVRIGVGGCPPGMNLSDYVLSRFLREEWSDMIIGITKAQEAVGMVISKGVDAAMNVFNRRVARVGGV